MKPGVVLLLLLGLLPSAAASQLPLGTREMLVEALAGDRDLALAMVDSMPARLLRFRPTNEVRDFAQQVDHVATTASFIVARFVLEDRPPVFGDSARYLATKAGLRQVVADAFDYCIRQVRELPDTALLRPARLFGREVPRWRVFLFVHSHNLWTLGQVVPYFRLNGMAPPQFGAF